MFTGIIETLGRVEAIREEATNKHFILSSAFTHELQIDQSVAHNGVCLTVVALDGDSYTVTAIDETLKKTNLNSLKVGDVVNLERCMQANGRFDGHVVQGHVDQTGFCESVTDENGSWKFTFSYDAGTGSGYQCCVLLQITPNVYTIEYNKPLYEKARRFFAKYGLKPHTFYGDGSEGLPQHAPYDKIIVTAGAPVVPRSLLKQLNIGGILVIPVGNESSQKMLRITRTSETGFEQEEFDDFKFVPLLGREGWSAQS